MIAYPLSELSGSRSVMTRSDVTITIITDPTPTVIVSRSVMIHSARLSIIRYPIIRFIPVIIFIVKIISHVKGLIVQSILFHLVLDA